ncbi:helix-turn-helix transcriptional regulator [Polaromonas sp.]|uniref:helix-turn-helix transcriptional regulator n=1 Tax=Polaromonas sp. TaxID=1869339 RepID=UPI00273156E1|nr:helix-turn-helix transcriptional regulator [Polaromonas sp.]MDP1888266.1 helix-turn-helix transcriptional regulator [Polaromonas sp.]
MDTQTGAPAHRPLPSLKDPAARRFGELLFIYREQEAISQTQLARIAGLSKSYLSSIENCRLRPPPIGTVQRIASALGLGSEECEVLEQSARRERTCEIRTSKYLPEHVRLVAQQLAAQAETLTKKTTQKLLTILEESEM